MKEAGDAGEHRAGLGKLGDLIRFLRWLLGWTQETLGLRSGIGRSQIVRYEKGEETPRRTNLQRIMAAFGVPLQLVEFLRWCLRLIGQALAAGRAEVPPAEGPALREKLLGAAERPLALARAELALLRNAPQSRLGHLPVEALFEKLISRPEAHQRLLLQASKAYRNPRLCMRLCLESERWAPADPAEALKLAKLALDVAGRISGAEPEDEAFRIRLEGWCRGFLANAQRVGSDLPLAEASFARCWRLWKAGKDEAGLLSEARLFDLEASLRRAQRLFPSAERLHERALAAARPEEVGHFLLNKSATLEQKGDNEGSIAVLELAARHVDGDSHPRLRCVLRFNHAANLIRLKRAQEAEPIVSEVRGLADRLGNESDLTRTRWLESNLAAGLGRRKEALAGLEEVRQAFLKLPFDFALASLDVALLYREEGRFAEIKTLAGEMLAIFEAQRVGREAIAAVVLFKEAAEKEQVTAELVKRLADYLRLAQREPGVKLGR